MEDAIELDGGLGGKVVEEGGAGSQGVKTLGWGQLVFHFDCQRGTDADKGVVPENGAEQTGAILRENGAVQADGISVGGNQAYADGV